MSTELTSQCTVTAGEAADRPDSARILRGVCSPDSQSCLLNFRCGESTPVSENSLQNSLSLRCQHTELTSAFTAKATVIFFSQFIFQISFKIDFSNKHKSREEIDFIIIMGGLSVMGGYVWPLEQCVICVSIMFYLDNSLLRHNLILFKLA